MLAVGINAGVRSYLSSSDLSSEDDKDEVQQSGIRSNRLSVTALKKFNYSSPHNASPSKRSASQMSNLTVSQRSAAREGDRRRKERQHSTVSDRSSSSSSEEEISSTHSFESSPKKKVKSTDNLSKSGKHNKKTSVPNKPSEISKEPKINKSAGNSELYQDYSEAIRQSQQENKARLAEMDRQLSMATSSPSSSASSKVPLRVKDLKSCPFCHEPMPDKASKKVKDLMQPWLDALHRKQRIGATSTVEACQRHRDEARTIPEGKSRGWRINLSENKLRAQVKNEKNIFMGVMRQRIENPTSSEWFNRIMDARRRFGRQAESASAQMQDMDEMQTGYFGELGKEVLYNTLVDVFIDHPLPNYDLKALCAIKDGPMQHLKPNTFIEKVLLPELVLLLIKSDQNARLKPITMEQARLIRDESVEYGIAMFPSSALASVASGRNAFGGRDEITPPASSSKKSSGSLVLQVEIKTDKKKMKPGNSPASSKNSPARRPVERKEARPRSKTPISIPSSHQVTSRPRPRPAARKIMSETASATDLTDSVNGSNEALPSQDMAGNDPNSAIIVSPDKPPATGTITIASSFDSTPQASQESVQMISGFDSPGTTSLPSGQDSIRQWRISGIRPGFE